jgi:hypothetical protein
MNKMLRYKNYHMARKPVPDTPQIRKLQMIAKLMDSQFTIPGTNIRFGLDALIGLIPGVGDLATFSISGVMLVIMAQNGASGFVMARMMLNVLIDTMIGAIPFLGDLFDIGFKANTRNIRLMQEHYLEGRHRGSAFKVIIPVMLLFFILFCAVGWLVYKLTVWVYHQFV